MKEENVLIKGSKKGGGGDVHVAQEAPNTLRSTQYARILDLLCEGEIEGLVDGDRSIYLDGTPLRAENGELNFKGFKYWERTGGPHTTQDPIPGFSDVEATESVGVKVTTSTPIVHNIVGPADKTTVTVSIPRLTKQNTSNGDLNGYYVDFKISVKSDLDTNYTDVGYYTWHTPNSSTTIVSATEKILHVNEGVDQISFSLKWTPPADASSNFRWCIFSDDGCPKTQEILANDVNVSVYYKKQSDTTYTLYKTYLLTRYSKSKLVTIGGLNNTSNYDVKVVITGGSGSYSVNYDYDNDDIVGFFHRYTGYNNNPTDYGSIDIVGVKAAGVYAIRRVQGKCTSLYKKSFTFDLPQGNSWDIKVTRVSADHDNDVSIQDELYFDSVTKIITSKLSYPYSAIIGLQIDASQFNKIPTRGYDVKLLKVQVPSNYNPVTRTYNGVWDGTWSAPVWTDNPAWCFRDIIVNNRYGLGDFIGPENIDDWKLYEIAKYCDELVPSPDGGVEPRLTMNVFLQTKEEAFKVLTTLASVFQGIIYWLDNQLTFSFEHPDQTAAIFSNTNVIDGVFNYTGISQKAVHNSIHVTWNDPNRQFKPAVEIVEDQEDIAKRGLLVKEVAAIGCTSRGQAHRLGMLALLAERYEQEIVNFKVSLENLGITPGSIIEVYDRYRANIRFSGRIAGATSTSIDLDQSITLQSGTAYYVNILIPEPQTETLGDDPNNTKEKLLPKIETRLITNTGTVTTLTFDDPLPTLPKNTAVWAVYEDNLKPQYFKVLGITESNENEYEVSAIKYLTNKYSISDSIYDLQVTEFNYATNIQGLVSNIVATEELYFSGPTLKNRIVISWDANVIASVRSFIVEYKKDDGDWQSVGKTKLTSIEIPDATPGSYIFRVAVESGTGVTSEWVESQAVNILGKTAPPSDVQNFQYSVDKNNGQILLTWDPVPDIDLKEYVIKLDDWATGPEVARVKATSYAATQFAGGSSFFIKAVDTSGNESLNYAEVYFGTDVGAPPIPLFWSSFEDKYAVLEWSNDTLGFRIVTFELRYGGVDWDSATFVGNFDTTSHKVLLDWQGDRLFRLKSTDSAGQQSNESTLLVTNAVPTEPSWNIAEFKDNNILLSWNPPSNDPDVVEYEIRLGTDWGNATLVAKTTDTTYTVAGTKATSLTYLIKSIDRAGQYSTNAASLVIGVQGPSQPVVNTSIDNDKLNLTWSNTKNNFDIKAYEVRYGSLTDTWGTATVIGTFSTTSYIEKVTWGADRRYFVKSYDIYGNESPIGTVDFQIALPGLSNVYTKVVDNNVLFYWTDVPATLPIAYVELKKGNDYSTAQVVGTKAGTFTTVFEDLGGTYTYWLTPIDTAGNAGTEQSLQVLVNEPPDYVLKSDYDSDFTGIYSSAILKSSAVYLPVNTTETYQEHFVNNGWNTPQDQINAGYPYYIEPTPISGFYEEVFDYGTTITSSTKISLTVTGNAEFGTPSVSTELSFSTDGVTFDRLTTNNQTIQSNFRYVKFKIIVSSTGGYDLYKITKINLKLDVKLKTDAGNGVVTATGGTSVSFNISFLDVASITVTPKNQTGTPVIAVYDFNDVPNPTGFTVYLYNSTNGTELPTGEFSWTARGF